MATTLGGVTGKVIQLFVFSDRSPATPAEFKRQSADYLDHLLKGRGTTEIRLASEGGRLLVD